MGRDYTVIWTYTRGLAGLRSKCHSPSAKASTPNPKAETAKCVLRNRQPSQKATQAAITIKTPRMRFI